MNSSSCCCWSRVYFSRQTVTLVLAAGVALGGGGCGKKAAGPPPRYAVLRFENLSGDAALEWTGRAASEVLTRTLAGALDGPVLARTALARLSGALGARPASAPGISTERTTAEGAGATRLIAGYIVKAGNGVQIQATDTDIATGTVVRTFYVRNDSPLQALTDLSTAFSLKAGKPQTTNAEALRLYCTSREEAADLAVPNLEKAVAADPTFGDAWVALVEARELGGNRAGAEEALAKARLQKLDPLDAAYLDFQASTLQDNQDARLIALKRVSDLSPGDTVLIRSLAETQTNKGQFAEAAHELHVRVHELGERVAVAFTHVDAHQPLAPTLDIAPRFLGIAEETSRQACWQLTRDCVDQLAIADDSTGSTIVGITDDGVDQLRHQGVDFGSPIGNLGTGELVLHQHSLLTMARVVLGDHVDLVRRPHRPVSLSAEEHVAAPLDLHDVGVTGDTPQAVAVVAVHRLVGTHPGPRVVWVAAVEVGIEKIDDEPVSRRAAGQIGVLHRCVVRRCIASLGHPSTVAPVASNSASRARYASMFASLIDS